MIIPYVPCTRGEFVHMVKPLSSIEKHHEMNSKVFESELFEVKLYENKCVELVYNYECSQITGKFDISEIVDYFLKNDMWEKISTQ